MSKTYEVIIERNNGHFRATLRSWPEVAVEAGTREEALWGLRQAATNYLQNVELETIELDVAVGEFPPGSPQAVLQASAACKLDTQSEYYQEYLDNLAAEKQRQREEAAAEYAAATS